MRLVLLALVVLAGAAAERRAGDGEPWRQGKEWWTAGAQARRSQARLARPPSQGVADGAAHGRRLSAARPASLPPAATAPAPAPLQLLPSKIYNPNVGAWDVAYNATVKAQQRAAGAKLRAQIIAAARAGKPTFSIPPGVYRLNETIPIESTVNFTLLAPGAELVVEGQALHFQLANNTNLAILGPLTLDADPFGFSQGTIVGTDNASYILYRLFPGYQPPDVGVRIMCFDADGTMLPLYQIPTASVSEVPRKPGLYNITMPPEFWTSYLPALRQAVRVGNYMAVAAAELAGGLNLVSNNGVYLADLAMHSASLIFGQQEAGTVSVTRLRGVRRPGTSRLAAGGFVALSLRGGSFLMRDSEASYNFDDITDIQAGLQYAFNQVSPTQVYIGYPDAPPLPFEVKFYNLETLAEDGRAAVIDLQPTDDSTLTAAFQNGLTDLGLLNWNNTPLLATLDRPVALSSQFALVDDQSSKAEAIVFENCYMHDSLASGINAKSARSIVIRNNTVVRAGYRGAAVGFDPYWWEGGVPDNILIEGNIIHATPYNQDRESAAINTYVDTSADLLRSAANAVIYNVTVANNLVTDPPVSGIELAFAAHNQVLNNTIVNPGARVADRSSADASQPLAAAAAIYLDAVGGVTYIERNTVVNADPQTVPQMVRASSATDPGGISLCNNTAVAGSGRRQPVPDEFWTSVPGDSGAVAYSGPAAGPAADQAVAPAPVAEPGTFAAIGDRLNSTFTFSKLTQPGARATFEFVGTRARWSSCVGPPYGLADVELDGERVALVDASLVSGLPDVTPDQGVGFCDQTLFDSGPLPWGQHSLTVVVAGVPGNESAEGAVAVAVEGFDYLRGVSACHAPAPGSLAPTALASSPAAAAAAAALLPATPVPAPVSQPPAIASPASLLPAIAGPATLPPIRFTPTVTFLRTAG